MSKAWPNREQALLRRYVAELDLDREGPHAGKPYESVLRRFQAFVVERSAQGSLDRKMVEAWLRECVKRSTLYMADRVVPGRHQCPGQAALPLDLPRPS